MSEATQASISVPDRQSNPLPRRWISAFVALSVCLILFNTWKQRYGINADGITYLDLARSASHGDFAVFLNPYWSPLYPALLAIALKGFSWAQIPEIVIAHIVNALLALAALLSFTFLVRETFSQPGANPEFRPRIDNRALLALAYALFLVATLRMVGVAYVTPDHAVTAIVFLAAGLGCRLANQRGGYGAAAWLGVALAFGYFAKAPLMPLGILLLLLLALPKIGLRFRLREAALAASVFAALTAPYVATLSHREHKLTFGESGYLNYAWHVQQNTPRFYGWPNPSEETGFPVHPVHLLMSNPTVYEFADAPVPGTFPLWYDPVYFHQGLRVKLDAQKVGARLAVAPGKLTLAFGLVLFPLTLGIALLAILSGRQLFALRWAAPWLDIWSILAIFMFSCVDVLGRYIAPFSVILLISVFSALACTRREKPQAEKSTVVFAIALCVFLLFLWDEHEDLYRAPGPVNDGLLQMAVARDLSGLGLHPGDEIAVLGRPFDVCFAHVAQLRIVAVIGDQTEENEYDDFEVHTDSFWALGQKERVALDQALAQHGVKAIVTSDRCAAAIGKGWRPLGKMQYCVLLIGGPGSS